MPTEGVDSTPLQATVEENKPKKFTTFDDPKHPLNSLKNPIRAITNYTGIKETTVVNTHKGLPVDIRTGWGISTGGFGVRIDEKGSPLLVISFDSEEGLTDTSEKYEWARREELFHLLHVTGNEKLYKLEVEGATAENKIKKLEREGVNEAVALCDKAKRYAHATIDKFLNRTGIKVPDQDEASKMKHALSLSDSDKKFFTDSSTSRLTYGQETRLAAAIKKNGYLTDHEINMVSQEIYRCERTLASIRQTQEEPDADSREKRNFIEDETREYTRARQYVYGVVRDKIEKLIAEGKESEALRIFNDASVNLDTVGNRAGWVRETIDQMPDNEIKDALLNLLTTDPNLDELSYLAYAVGNPTLSLEINEAMVKDTEKMQEIKKSLQDQLRGEDSEKVSANDKQRRKETLYQLLVKGQRESVAQAMIEQNLMWFADDLPPKGPQRTALLQNPEFMKIYEEAILAALKDPQASPLGPIDFDPSEIAKDRLQSEKVLDAALERSTKNLDAAAFVEASREKTAFLIKFGSLADSFEQEAEAHKDEIILTMGLDPVEFELLDNLAEKEGTTPEEILKKVNSQATLESLEYMQLKQDHDLKHTEEQFLLEPIAKVVVAQSMGLGIDSISFPQGMMGGYSELLREGGIKGWLEKLWQFVEKAHKNGESGGRKMLEFMQAKNLEQQQNVVAQYRYATA